MVPRSGRASPAKVGRTRRQVLQVGGLGVLGLTLPELLRSEQAPGRSPRAPHKSCILLYCYGGPAHQDVWDLKPDAPAEVRGEFRPIRTSVPGTLISEHLPRLARQAHRFTIVRSVTHRFNQHNPAALLALTGHPGRADVPELQARPDDAPAYGATLARLTGPAGLVPPFVAVPAVLKDGVYLTPGQFGGWLGRQHDPLFVEGDPNDRGFAVPGLTPPPGVSPGRLAGRTALLARANGAGPGLRQSAPARAMEGFQERALALVRSPAARQAFDLSREPAGLRERYGRNTWGQCALLARRLVEAGTRMVSIHWSPDFDRNWDTHGNNFRLLREMLLPQLDLALSALLADLCDRGLLDSTLVVCMGEFGRTPRVNQGAGRDHWPGCYSVVLAGGGVRGGRVLGRSDRDAAYPADWPVSPQDVAATIYTILGVRPDAEVHDQLNRPHRLVENGGPIRELLG